MEQVKQYDIVLVKHDQKIGSEMKKTRPCVVLSPNEMNKYLQTIVIAPMASSSKPYPTRIEIMHKNTKGWIAIDQIRTIDRLRIVKCFETLTDKEIEKLKKAIQETFVD
jgi:mRNA interferase MazF